MKPMLATDADESKLRFPLGMQVKIDGVRALTPEGHMVGRSGKQLGNRYTTAFYTREEYAYLDGELAAELETHPDLCRITSSATSTHAGQPYTIWHVFDFLHPEFVALDYAARHAGLTAYIKEMQERSLCLNARVVPLHIANSLEELLAFEEWALTQGYEGIIIRDLAGAHKQGRSTVKQMGLLRIKRFLDFECVVKGIVEGQHNGNEAEYSPHGYVERSTHQENMVPNGMVGAMQCVVIKDVEDPVTKMIVLRAGQDVTVGPGNMPHAQRKEYLEQPLGLLEHVIKAKFFPKGIKDKPRFPTYISHRDSADM